MLICDFCEEERTDADVKVGVLAGLLKCVYCPDEIALDVYE